MQLFFFFFYDFVKLSRRHLVGLSACPIRILAFQFLFYFLGWRLPFSSCFGLSLKARRIGQDTKREQLAARGQVCGHSWWHVALDTRSSYPFSVHFHFHFSSLDRCLLSNYWYRYFMKLYLRASALLCTLSSGVCSWCHSGATFSVVSLSLSEDTPLPGFRFFRARSGFIQKREGLAKAACATSERGGQGKSRALTLQCRAAEGTRGCKKPLLTSFCKKKKIRKGLAESGFQGLRCSPKKAGAHGS